MKSVKTRIRLLTFDLEIRNSKKQKLKNQESFKYAIIVTDILQIEINLTFI